jgi:hypothetical protein
MIALSAPRVRVSHLPLFWRATDCIDESGIFARGFGKRLAGVFTRASLATNELGDISILRTPSGAPRISLNKTTAGAYERALVLERAGASWTYTTDASNAVYTKSNTSTPGPVTDGPDGQLTAYKLVEAADVAQLHHHHRLSSAHAADDYQSCMWELRPAGRTRVVCRIEDQADSGNRINCDVDLTTATILSFTISGTGVLGHARVTRLPRGYVRVEISGMGNPAATQSRCRLFLHDGVGTTYDGNGTGGVDIACVQWEDGAASAGAFPSSRMPAGAVAGARAADLLGFPFPAKPFAMTVYVRGMLLHPPLSLNARRLWHIGSNAATTPALYAEVRSTNNFRLNHSNGTTLELANVTNSTLPQVGDLIEVRAILRADGSVRIQQVTNGAAAVGSLLVNTPNAFAAAWAGSPPRFWFAAAANGNQHPAALTHVLVAPGEVEYDTFRELAGL